MFVHFFPNSSKFLVCLSVLQLAYILTKIRPIQGYILSWIMIFFEIVLRHSLDVSTLFSNNLNFLYVCQSFSWLPSLFQDNTVKTKAWKSPFKGIFSSALTPWPNAELYILLPALTYLIPHFLTDLLQKKVEKICQYGCWESEIWYVSSLDTIIMVQK